MRSTKNSRKSQRRKSSRRSVKRVKSVKRSRKVSRKHQKGGGYDEIFKIIYSKKTKNEKIKELENIINSNIKNIDNNNNVCIKYITVYKELGIKGLLKKLAFTKGFSINELKDCISSKKEKDNEEKEIEKESIDEFNEKLHMSDIVKLEMNVNKAKDKFKGLINDNKYIGEQNIPGGVDNPPYYNVTEEEVKNLIYQNSVPLSDSYGSSGSSGSSISYGLSTGSHISSSSSSSSSSLGKDAGPFILIIICIMIALCLIIGAYKLIDWILLDNKSLSSTGKGGLCSRDMQCVKGLKCNKRYLKYVGYKKICVDKNGDEKDMEKYYQN